MEWSIKAIQKRSPVFSTVPQALTILLSSPLLILFSLVRDGPLFLKGGEVEWTISETIPAQQKPLNK